ncbi:hypothetical protein BOTBODRAFT_635029 [Botryobasidium botryosum FD-172 SS1]|uniref:PARP catalytic domain-containing protein n=1 Tax=Botryobasidium botryosum (strain FD-172 SS1) TaxID=930990 RepID=A0A067MBQ7_BOTB1|nr:hypothetical protein BOTBODRAFT_635029 [Botryobasidium botryosum FD-172 SS1]
MKCLTRLCNGEGDKSKCNYCHNRPKFKSYNQCGQTCRNLSREACLMCRCRPRLGKYHFCGRTCKKIAMGTTPRILKVPRDHVTWKMVETKFNQSWNPPPRRTTPRPTIKYVYKVVENQTFLSPYDSYKKRVGKERFCYHGTSRACQLGNIGQTKLCNQSTCGICGVLKTSYKVGVANASGGFGAGVYTSTASNKAHEYIGSNGAMLLNKVCLGNVYNASHFRQVTSLPPGYNSVVFNNDGGQTNETIVYENDAIRPVFLIVF